MEEDRRWLTGGPSRFCCLIFSFLFFALFFIILIILIIMIIIIVITIALFVRGIPRTSTMVLPGFTEFFFFVYQHLYGYRWLPSWEWFFLDFFLSSFRFDICEQLPLTDNGRVAISLECDWIWGLFTEFFFVTELFSWQVGSGVPDLGRVDDDDDDDEATALRSGRLLRRKKKNPTVTGRAVGGVRCPAMGRPVDDVIVPVCDLRLFRFPKRATNRLRVSFSQVSITISFIHHLTFFLVHEVESTRFSWVSSGST